MNDASDNGADAYTREETYAATRRPVDLAQTLLPDAYTSDAFFAIERERVFAAGRVVAGSWRRCASRATSSWRGWRPLGVRRRATATAACGPSTTSAATAVRGS